MRSTIRTSSNAVCSVASTMRPAASPASIRPGACRGRAPELRGRIPAIGADAEALLSDWLAMDAGQVDRLRTAGAVGGVRA